MKKGISLIVLIVTIIVIIILAATVILSISENNPISSAKEAAFKEDVRAFQDELNMYIGKEYMNMQGDRNEKINAKQYTKDGSKNSVYTYVPDFKKKYEGKLAIKDDMIAYIGSDEKEKEWLLNSGVYMSKTLTVKFVDQDENKIKEDMNIAVLDNYYSIELPEIDGYIRISERLEGNITQDMQVVAEYYLPNNNLAFIGLDSSGKETNDESNIVAYEVSGIGECNVSKIAIPKEHNGKAVTKIKSQAFKENKILKSIIITDNIKNIGSQAFWNCTNLKQVSCNAQNIEKLTFQGCSELKKVIIGKNVSSWADQIFFSCDKFDDLTILSETLNVGNNNLTTKSSLKEIKVNEDNNKYMVENGILFSKDGSKIYVYPTGKLGDTYTISNNIKEIGDYAFYNSDLKFIDIPDTVERVGNSAFGFCSNLEKATINANILGRLTFYGSGKLEKVTIGKNVSSWLDQTFLSCNNLSDLTILSDNLNVSNENLHTSSSLKEIKINEDNSKYMVKDGILFSKDGTKLYAYPTGKTGDTYTIPNNVKEIGQSAFYKCVNLKNINIPDTVESVENSAFGFCSNLEEITVNANKLGRLTFYGSGKLEKVTIGSNVGSWSDQIFLSCNKIQSITYLGTKEQWNNILGKSTGWKVGNTSIKKIICSDGEITL